MGDANSTSQNISKMLYETQSACELACLGCLDTTCGGSGFCEPIVGGVTCHAWKADSTNGPDLLCGNIAWNFGSGSGTGWTVDDVACVEVADADPTLTSHMYQDQSSCEIHCLKRNVFKISGLSSQTYTWIVLGVASGIIALGSFLYQQGYLAGCSTKRWNLVGPKPYQRSALHQASVMLKRTASKLHHAASNLESPRSEHKHLDKEQKEATLIDKPKTQAKGHKSGDVEVPQELV